MRHLLSCVVFCALGSVVSAQPAQWVTVKGQVVFPKEKDIPKREALKVTQDKEHCLAKGDILDESILVNPKTRGIKNVVVYLRPDNNKPDAEFAAGQIHPADA